MSHDGVDPPVPIVLTGVWPGQGLELPEAPIELAARISAARMGGAIEVRPSKEW